jgi:hypothetical protein
MKNLLKKLTRGHRRKRSFARENRWLNWAQSLADRHSRVGANRRGLSLTFLQPARTPLFSCERWVRAAWTIAPQINLSISRILRFLQPSGEDESAGMRMTERRGKTIVDRRGESPRMVAVEHIEGLAAKRRSDALQKPLQRVFARAMAEESGETATASRAQRETVLLEQSLRITRRVVDERRRVEERPRRTLVTREQRGDPRPTAAVQETVMQSPRGLQVGAQGLAQTTAPVIDIEQLTDRIVRNIDSRIIAHRERMGRLF